MTFETGRRLCLLVEAGGARWALEASAVLEVFRPRSGKGPRGVSVVDLPTLFGAPARPETDEADASEDEAAVVLDTSPTLAIRVDRVLEVADVAKAEVFGLPPGLGERLPLVVRGALVHDGKLFLELDPEPLAQRLPWEPVPARPIFLLETPPERALLFTSHGRAQGIPLAWVSRVVAWDDAFCPLPGCLPVLGLQPHGQALWPVHSANALIGAASPKEPLLILTELAGQNVGLSASAVAGIQTGLLTTDEPGSLVRSPGGPASLFLDWQRMFS